MSARSGQGGGRVKVRGVVVTAGTVARELGENAKGVFMQCSAAQAIPSPKPSGSVGAAS